jgi:predicted transposase/invertase (TIGR01784 family)
MLLMEYDYATDIEVQREEAFEKGLSQGEYQGKIQTAKNLIAKKISIDIIADCTGLSVDVIKTLM